MDLLIRKDFTPDEIKRAELAQDEFRRNRFTTAASHLDDLVTLGKAVLLCDSHKRKFSAKHAHYEQHPAANLRRVIGNCDVCNMPGLNTLFVSSKDAAQHRQNWAKARTAREYGTIVSN